MKFSQAYLALASLASTTMVSASPIEGPVVVDSGLERRAAGDFQLRIMPLGASVTDGVGSTDGNGYRKALRQQLRFDGWAVNMVGSLPKGNMVDRDQEGWSGLKVSDITAKARAVVPSMKPNLVLINAGRNDATQNDHISTIGVRQREMIQYILDTVPDTVVIFSTILPGRPDKERVDQINAQYGALARAMREDEKKRVFLANLSTGWIDVNKDITGDGIHPNDGGYLKMAALWHEAINSVYNLGWLSAPKSSTNEGKFGDDGPIVDPNLPKPPK